MHILLTGAGFTKNWDGLLASEFQAALVSDARVRGRSRLLELVANTPSFELAFAWNASNTLETIRAALGTDIIPLVANAPLTTLFPPDQSKPAELDRIIQRFFAA